MPHMRREPELPEDIGKYALFLDFDGTLAEIAPQPWLASLDPDTARTLAALWQRVDGALALISGRELDDIDAMVGLPQLPAAGIHGAQLRSPGGQVATEDWMRAEIDEVEADLRNGIQSFEGLLLERKPVAVAVHYRGNPGREEEIRALAARIVRPHPHLKCLSGRKIVEILPARVDKGRAIARLMELPPFFGRIPLFAGDDITDEDGLVAVKALGGIAIKIGGGPSVADYGFPTGERFRHWLHQLALQVPAEKSA